MPGKQHPGGADISRRPLSTLLAEPHSLPFNKSLPWLGSQPSWPHHSKESSLVAPDNRPGCHFLSVAKPTPGY